MTDTSEPNWQSGARASTDLATLRESLAAAERRAATLAELTALMSQGRDPLVLAQRAVEFTARTTRAAGAFVYLWDRDEERLVLSVATEGWQRMHLGAIKLRLGEGITGWSALMRQSVFVKDPLRDPRFRSFPELRESSFKSMIAVPIVAPGEEVLGVFSLYALSEDGFIDTDVSLASEVGALLASGLVQAKTLSQLRIQSAAARFLCDVPDDAWGSLEQCLHAMARECVAHMEAAICLIEVTADHVHPHRSTSVVAVTERFREEQSISPTVALDKVALTQILAPLDLQRLRIPLGPAAPVGALTCYRPRRFSSDDEILLEAIGAQVAAGALSLFGRERVRPVLEQLLSSPDPATTEQLLRRHGWDLRPVWATMLRLQSKSVSDLRGLDDDRVRAALLEIFGGDDHKFLLLGGGNGRYLALAEHTDPTARERLAGRLSELARQPGMRLSAGIGPLATPPDTHRSIKHAFVASQWAELTVSSQGAVVRHEEVAHLRLLPSTALSMSADLKLLLDALGPVVKYDLEHGADLAQTLDALLANGGSVAKTSAQLFIHRNTLRQRIQRIEELIGQSPENFEDFAAAGLAARLVRQNEVELDREPNARGNARRPHGVLTVSRSSGLPNNCSLLPARPTTPADGRGDH